MAAVSWSDVRVLYLYELRAALRERTILVNSVLVPLLLYPGMIFLGITGFTVVQSQTEGLTSRVLLAELPAAHQELGRRLREQERLTLLEAHDDSLARLVERVSSGEADAAVVPLPPTETASGLADNFRLQIVASSSRERSRAARRRVEEELDRYRREWLAQRAQGLGVGPPAEEIFALEGVDTASGRETGAFILGLLLPLTFVIMVAIGCFNPAIDTTAGERERNTWETTLTLATSRINVVAAKYLYVVTFGTVAGLLNLAALTLSMRAVVAGLDLAGESLEFAIPWTAWPLLVLCAALLAGSVGAAMILCAAFARTFREGQSMVMPVYLVTFLPALLLNDPGLHLDLPLSFVPIGNVILVVRDLITGTLPWLETGVTCVVQVGLITLFLWLASLALRFEDVLVGSYSGNLFQFARQRWRARRSPPEMR